mmetsp:Transcript_34498/g.74559  ORF Transcript_34498/g.74559 Transcript_34498/m.74559 type:complete len:161 (+) Transcript_34498:315-797(+)
MLRVSILRTRPASRATQAHPRRARRGVVRTRGFGVGRSEAAKATAAAESAEPGDMYWVGWRCGGAVTAKERSNARGPALSKVACCTSPENATSKPCDSSASAPSTTVGGGASAVKHTNYSQQCTPFTSPGPAHYRTCQASSLSCLWAVTHTLSDLILINQ